MTAGPSFLLALLARKQLRPYVFSAPIICHLNYMNRSHN